MTSARPPSAASGMPPPMTLPNVIRSTSTGPSGSNAHQPPAETRKPVSTSSETSRAPFACAISAIARLKPGCGTTTPMFAAAASVMTAAMAPGCVSNASRSAASSLYGSTSVCAAIGAGTPAEAGSARVATPEPASASRPSEWPW